MSRDLDGDEFYARASRTVDIVATPFTFRDPRQIPPRQWLFGRHYIRRFVSATIAASGIGKSSLTMVEAVSMATGRALLGGDAPRPLRVWIVNLEDPGEELERRAAAIMKHYRIGAQDVGDRFYLDSGRNTPIKLAARERDHVEIAEPLVESLVREIRRRRLDVVIVDPFVSSHGVPENDNGAIDLVVKAWGRIADETNCSIELVHHVRKPASGAPSEVNVDDARGAGALIGAVRSARVLNGMTKDEAKRAQLEPSERQSFFRVDRGKANMAPPADRALWRKLVGVPLDNGTETDPGDWIAVATGWQMPSNAIELSMDDLAKVQAAIAEGTWSASDQADDWAGYAIAKSLNLPHDKGADRRRLKSLLDTWTTSGGLKIDRRRDMKKGRQKPYVIVGAEV